MNRRCSQGFTLIEILIVVAIMAIIASTVISRFLNTADDAKTSSLRHNRSVVETQLEVYRAQHLNKYPTIQDDGLPQLTNATNAAGEIGDAGSAYPLGPYIVEAPTNPFDGSKKVTAVAEPGKAPTAVVGALGGWQYDASNGTLWPNNPKAYK